ncbi:hypothetical protein GCM10009747_32130 [Agromyces humatus]|uniref:Uncharacterized protein n=1 Tax=Agromyces humatus TaxID=279573 RepID=A0ABP4X9G7_9MICO
MNFIWATRGRTWGTRFVRDGGYRDPLPVYDEAFSGAQDGPEVWRRVGEIVALRFSDPDGRRDRAGRVISHEFVLFPPEANRIDSIEKGRQILWPEVQGEYARVWESTVPPTASA